MSNRRVYIDMCDILDACSIFCSLVHIAASYRLQTVSIPPLPSHIRCIGDSSVLQDMFFLKTKKTFPTKVKRCRDHYAKKLSSKV